MSALRVQFGDFLFDSATRELTHGKDSIRLSPKAFHLLHILLERRPAAVSKEELIETIWSDVHVEEANLKNLVAEIRHALRGADGSEEWITTVHRFGYRFSGQSNEQPQATPIIVVGGSPHSLSRGDNLIGRGADCTIVLRGSGVSRHHAAIRVSSGTAFIEDRGSKNGTSVNGRRISGAVGLNDGDTIRIGVVTLVFRHADVSDTTALSD